MNVQLPRTMDSAAFLAWAEGREGRYELADGRVIMMTGGSYGHAVVVRGLFLALNSRLAGADWIVLTSDLAVSIGARTVRYPDVVVSSKVGKRVRDLTATAPTLVAEVISPSSVTNDFGDKATEYMRLDSVSVYLVLSQDEPKAWVWVRNQGIFSGGSEVVAGSDGVIALPPLAIELPLAEIYAELPPPES
jgi:Uma2 family endonuclease